jgi:hypothetical protein
MLLITIGYILQDLIQIGVEDDIIEYRNRLLQFYNLPDQYTAMLKGGSVSKAEIQHCLKFKRRLVSNGEKWRRW